MRIRENAVDHPVCSGMLYIYKYILEHDRRNNNNNIK